MSDIIEDRMTYEDTLTYSQSIRKQIVSHYMNGGVPKDTSEVGVILKALKDMDVTALENKRNAIEENNSDSARKMAEAMNEFIKMQQNANPFKAGGSLSQRQVPELDVSKLGTHQIVPDEMETAIIVEEADDFIRRMNEKRLAKLKEEDGQ